MPKKPIGKAELLEVCTVGWIFVLEHNIAWHPGRPLSFCQVNDILIGAKEAYRPADVLNVCLSLIHI